MTKTNEKAKGMKLVVGLGNPGRKYEGTRHNVGFETVVEIARRHSQSKGKAQFDAEVADADLSGAEDPTVRALLLLPDTYMNRSGSSVLKARDFYKLSEEEILVVCDDFNLPLGKLRVRAKGSAGGQKGLDDIIRKLGTNQFARVRIGIGPVPRRWDAADFVLGKFTKTEREEMKFAIPRAADAAVHWARNGIESCMNRYNASASMDADS